MKASLRGSYRIRRYDRATGELVGTIQSENAIQAAGRNLMLDLGIGVSTSHFDNAGAVLEVEDGGGSDVFTQVGADSGFPDLTTQGEVTWQWSDETTDTYTVDTVRMRQGSISGTIFSEVTGGPFSTNSKPSNENWIYEYTLFISEGTFPDLTAAGLHSWLEIMAGDRTSGENWSNMQLRIENSSAALVGTESPDSGSPSRSGGTVTWIFTSEDGSDEGDWHDPIIKSITWPSGDVVLSEDSGGGNQEGTKSSGNVWEYTYTFTLSI